MDFPMAAEERAAGRCPRVAVVGGGFCGAFFAAQLARHAAVPVAITVIEPRPALGAGVAYGTDDPAHRVNVPSTRMSIYAEDPGHFDRWFAREGGLADDPEARWRDGQAYPRRGVFGRYVAEVVAAARDEDGGPAVRHVRDRAVTAARERGGYRIGLAGGGTVEADILVLAASHPPPGPPALLAAGLDGDPALIANPWAPGALEAIGRDAPVLVVGTGLTAADIVASLAARGHRGPVTAYSRRGLLPRGHAPAQAWTWYDTHEPPHAMLPLLREVRARIAEAGADGLPWQAVFDNLRANGQRIWRGIPLPERRRFLRHLRAFWDVHRYRIAPQVEAVLRAKQADGSLRVLAASLASIGRAGDAIEAVLRPRRAAAGAAAGAAVTVRAAHVVLATGPAHGAVVAQNPVLRDLAAQGLIQGDPLGLGIAADAEAHTVRPDGGSEPGLLIVGPLAREQYGELMGMPQIAAHADAVARQVAARLAALAQPVQAAPA